MKTIKLGQTTKILLKEGDKLFSQGDEGDSAYMIVYGHVDVLVDDKKKGASMLLLGSLPSNRSKSTHQGINLEFVYWE